MISHPEVSVLLSNRFHLPSTSLSVRPIQTASIAELFLTKFSQVEKENYIYIIFTNININIFIFIFNLTSFLIAINHLIQHASLTFSSLLLIWSVSFSIQYLLLSVQLFFSEEIKYNFHPSGNAIGSVISFYFYFTLIFRSCIANICFLSF